MVSMAVETFCRIGVAERVDLSVITRQIAPQLLLMTRAAVLCDDQLGRSQDRVLDLVTSMAVRADRGLEIVML